MKVNIDLNILRKQILEFQQFQIFHSLKILFPLSHPIHQETTPLDPIPRTNDRAWKHKFIRFSLRFFLYRTRANIFWWMAKKEREKDARQIWKERRTKMDFLTRFHFQIHRHDGTWSPSLVCAQHPFTFLFDFSSLIQRRNLSISDGFLLFSLHLAQSKAPPYVNCYRCSPVFLRFRSRVADETIWQSSFLLLKRTVIDSNRVISQGFRAHTLSGTEQFI